MQTTTRLDNLTTGDLIAHPDHGLCRVITSYSLSLYGGAWPWAVSLVSVSTRQSHSMVGDGADEVGVSRAPRRVAA